MAPKPPSDMPDNLAAWGKSTLGTAERIAGTLEADGEAPSGSTVTPEGEGDTAALESALGVTPDHAKKLMDAAQTMPGCEGLDAQALADKLKDDGKLRDELEKKISNKPAAEAKPEGEGAEGAGAEDTGDLPSGGEEMADYGDTTEDGTAVWPGSPSKGKPKGKSAGSESGMAPWMKA